MEIPAVKAVIEEVESGNGRQRTHLVRPSGTEPLLRVMAEAETDEKCHDYVMRIVNVVKAEIGI